MSLIQRIWYSITTRLVVLFLLIGGCGFVLFLTLFRLYTSTQASFTPYPVPFLSYLVEQLPSPNSSAQVDELMAETVFALRIEGKNQAWFSDESIPKFSQLIADEMLSDNVGYYFSENKNRYLVIKQDERRFIFAHRFVNPDDSAYRLVVLLIPLLAVLLLMLGYFIAGRFFIPISWIGEGDLSYRIPYRRNDELGQLVDIVNQMAEDLERIFDSKRQLLLAISHELRSPLTRMKLNVALLEESKVSLRLSDDIDDMRDIVEGLLDSERLQGQHKAIDRVEVDAEQLIWEIVEENDESANIELNFIKPLNLVYVDIAKIKFLLRNLIKNALKYTDPETRKIEVLVYTKDHKFYIEVNDNGCGIAQEHKDHIFSPFYRADQSRGRKTGGVGLGLYLCLLIAKAHSGDIEVTSELGKGSRFLAYFPQDKRSN